MGETLNASPNGYEVSIGNLTYTHREGASPSLSDVNIHLPKGSRTILVGANGGKQSLLVKQMRCSAYDLCMYSRSLLICSREIHAPSDFGRQTPHILSWDGRQYQGQRCVPPDSGRDHVFGNRMVRCPSSTLLICCRACGV